MRIGEKLVQTRRIRGGDVSWRMVLCAPRAAGRSVRAVMIDLLVGPLDGHGNRWIMVERDTKGAARNAAYACARRQGII